MKRILIDVNSVVPYYALGRLNGIGRTVLELVPELSKLQDLPFSIELYSQNIKGIGGVNLATRFKCHHLYAPNRNWANNVISKLCLRELLTDYDLMHIPHNYERVAHPERCVATIHDAMFFSYPETVFNPEFCRKYYTEFAHKCRAVITCSEASKADIVQYMDVPPEKVFVTPWGYRTDLFFPRERENNEWCGNAPFFVSSSCDTGRKNTISIIRAFAIYRRHGGDHHLVLVWRNPSREVIEEEVVSLGVADTIHFAQNIPDKQLASLYSSATACFFPSLYEGFGLPILESLASGTPVVTARNSSLPEVGGDAALYVDPYDLEAMSGLMTQFEQMASEDYDQLVTRSLEQAHTFSWERCARQTVDVYKYCLEI